MRIIVNADDFGASRDVNAAVVAARRDGVLTSASLMVTGPRAVEAIEIARADPGLVVGLHLTMSNGLSTLPHRLIPDLVDQSGRFIDSPTRAALKYFFSARAREQLRLEIEAQFEAFAETGLGLSHVDGHQHLHAHPAAAPTAAEMAVRYGASGFRIPREPFWPGLSVDRSAPAEKAVVGAGHAYLSAVCRRRLRGSGLAVCEAAIGGLMSGRMSVEYVIGVLERLECGAVEVFFHPSTSSRPEPDGPNRGDLDALVDPRLRQFISARGYVLSTYADVAKGVGAGDLA